MVRLMQSKSPFQRLWLVCFHRNTVFLKTDTRLVYSLQTHTLWKGSVQKYKNYGTWVRLPFKKKNPVCSVRQVWSSSAQRNRKVWSRWVNVLNTTNQQTNKITSFFYINLKIKFILRFLSSPQGIVKAKKQQKQNLWLWSNLSTVKLALTSVKNFPP